MRRTYISPEFKYNLVFGTLNMEEESSFFGSKMLEIDDVVEISNQSLIYYQNQYNEQLDLEKEYDFPPVVFDSNNVKKIYHTIVLDELQTISEKNNYAKWIMNINLKDTLRDYLFAILKKYRTFEGISNDMTLNQNIDISIKDYIERNVLNRYKFSNVELYLVPVDILSNGVLKYSTTWDIDIALDEYKFTKFSTITDFMEKDVKIYFSQNYPASQYAFRYYFNLIFTKL